MRPSQVLDKHRQGILDIARRHGVSNVRVFGSVSRRDDTEDSDVDLLVEPSETTTLLDLARLKREAETLTGVPFDVRTPLSLSPRFRARVLREARPL
ncbi:nucleotidyltransferase family protein [Skermanella mucosa]|uniref:Nucleotidyltransferase family protein n=1 Tax=Skermanella cutis TaxID=2775420 RepID=A0ABX7B743_9PROT|nr:MULTISPECIES: nucleotidyltransferase family protein [Skermanella]QQP89570.1 nucleotidyltransferase family protein [Skermanella sp. TT6]UEM03715.1 nucleotidyltransferase family protein [Skermanella rosea]UEM21059.1 nucleotidyltransferase family protein [Skermanella mucosa]